MLNYFGQSLRIGIARNSMSLVRTSSWTKPAVTVLAELRFATEENDTPEKLTKLLRQLLANTASAHHPVTVVIADDLTRLWQVTPPPGTTQMTDLQAATALRFQILFGEALADWTITADWNARTPFLAAALPCALLAVLEQQADEHQFSIVEIAPQFILAWNRWHIALQAGAWFALTHDQVFTLGITDGESLCAVRSVLLPPEVDRIWLQAHLERVALLLDVPMPTHLQLCGALIDNWSEHDINSGVPCRRVDSTKSSMPMLTIAAALAQAGVWN
ncbi:MAG: hypothetical protein Q7R66_14815 [Undibacterium sp.]|uniref:hypothetical protein n=1 Tax=Undibacterium sp. TaxID=1914977 RepID=UPI002721FE64|nr:hypothetical protein [Undibacterium sp.]MDO8653456.1 hypothetical protein [Undibacterium sp.]